MSEPMVPPSPAALRKQILEEAAMCAQLAKEEELAARDDCIQAGNPEGALTRARQAQTAGEIETNIRALVWGE